MTQQTATRSKSEAARLALALDHAAELFGCYDCVEPFTAMQCAEADAVARVFALAGHREVAEGIIRRHGSGDEDPGRYETDEGHFHMATNSDDSERAQAATAEHVDKLMEFTEL
jgi:hypothetical protein